MKKSTSSQPQTLKSTLGIISLLIAAMTFNSCEKMDDMYPEPLSEGTRERETQIRLIPDTKLERINQVDKPMSLSSINLDKMTVISQEAQDINSEIKTDSENRPNQAGYTTNMTTTIAVDPRD